uniref:Putative ribonuclease BN n=1 Tax=Solibacter usitatus (strain Ellin6076) TaxID=234267 RepID=Q01ZF1_SOLUE
MGFGKRIPARLATEVVVCGLAFARTIAAARRLNATASELHMKRHLDLLKETYRQWSSHDAPAMGAAVAFYSLVSLAPLVILLVGICALVFGAAGAQAQLLEQFRGMVGDEGARAIRTVLTSAQKPATGVLASLFGLITLLLGASGVFIELRAALNKLWDAESGSIASGIWSFIKDRFLSIGMVLAIGFLLLVSLAISAGLGALGKFFGSLGFLPPVVWEAVNFVVSLGVVAGLFALILRFVPNIRLPWHDIGLGAVLTAVLFTIGKTAIGIYLGKAGVGSAYGAAGSLVLIIVWVYYSAQIFFFGAMFTRVYAQAHGWQPKSAPHSKEEHARATPIGVRNERAARDAAAAIPSIIAKLAAAWIVLAAVLRRGLSSRPNR